MARQINRLNARLVSATNTPGRYADGNGLYLRVTETQKSWVYNFRWRGKRTEAGLGSVASVSLADARRKADEARKRLKEGLHPAKQRSADTTPSFGEFADEYIRLQEPSWKNAKHRDQWRMTLGRARDDSGNLTRKGYCLSLASKRVDEITMDDVLSEIAAIWSTKPETASRIRGRIETVLDAAKARGHRSGENPAAWRGNLALVLPARQKTKTVKHHAAMHHDVVPSFLVKLSNAKGMGALALEFLIYTAARSGEVRGATWAEFDLKKEVWTVPADRMKAGREHRVPLSAQAIEILERVRALPGADNPEAIVFPSTKRTPLSDMTLTACLRRLGHGDVTAHGFRSSFRDWAGDCTSHPRELIEQALAHVVGGVEGAYRRSDALEKRRVLMADWAEHLEGPRREGDNVMPLRQGLSRV